MKLLLFYILLLLSCNSSKNIIGKRLIEGKWVWLSPRNTMNYPGLEFRKGGYATFESFGDTVYTFKYHFKKNDLQIVNINGDKIYHNKILKLTSDSLIFENLIELEGKQIYYKEKW